ncbi:MAG: TonB-dependent receptor [Niastella sp.]|nr:TonB-dependent receptor [Niastella sp.]
MKLLCRSRYYCTAVCILLLIFSLLPWTPLHAQEATRVFRGTVTNESGEALNKVSVTIKGTSKGAVTDSSGRFEIAATPGNMLVFSRVGHASFEVRTSSTQTDIAVKLTRTGGDLDQVIVVGYGTQKKSDITGSVTSVPKDRLSKIPVTNVLQAVEGSVAGWNLSQTSAAPGSSANQQVRGINSINASTTPLIILDGVPFAGLTNDISPATIESVEVLKDASATAIYGTRGSSGVILITTKRGATGKPTIAYNAFAGPEFRAHTLRPMNADEYKLKNVVWNRQMGRVNPNPVNDSVPNAFEVTNLLAGKTVDWMDEVSRQGFLHSHNLSISGGSREVKYYLNGEYTKDNGLLKGYQYTRVSLRSNLNATLTDWLALGTSLFYTNNNTDGGKVNLTLAGQMSPYGQLYNPDGTYAIWPMYGNTLYTNPLLGLYQASINRGNNLTGTGYVDVTPKFLKGLKYRLNGNYTYLPSRNASYSGRNMNDNLGTANVNSAETISWIVENILSYTKDFGDHHIDVTALYSAQRNRSFSSNITARGFVNDGLNYNNTSAATTQTTSTNSSSYSIASQMGRLNYSFAGKYLLTATVRRDGYSGFGGQTDKYGTFPSVALGWNISQEKFMDDIAFVNSLKLRVSYGTTGNSAINPYQTQTSQNIVQYTYNNVTATGLTASNLGNASLKWESTTAQNIGLDFSLLKNRINGTIEVYKTETKDLLLSRQLPIMTGYGSVLANIGKLENRGLDITLNSVNVQTGKFMWQTAVVFSTYKNKLTQLYGDGKNDLGNGWFIGKSLGAIYTYRLLGVWQEGEDPSGSDPTAKSGFLKFADLDGSKTINASGDREIVGYTNPKWTGGITNTFTYGNFSLRVFIQTFQGAMRNNAIYNNADQSGAINIPAEVGYWTKENKNNSRPSLSYTNPLNYAYPSVASYTRLKDVTLNYVVPAAFAGKYGFSAASFYISGRNIKTWTPWLGWDPETNFQSLPAGTNYNNYPQVSSYVLGVNLTLK